MKLKVILTCIVLLGFSLNLKAGLCSCGTHETGIYDYHTDEAGLCCSGTPNGGLHGSFTTYVFVDGSWQIERRTNMTSADAQARCCPTT